MAPTTQYRSLPLAIVALLVGFAIGVLPPSHFVSAQVVGQLDALSDVGVTEKLDQMLPLGLKFVSETGRSVSLGQLLTGDTPAILSLNYSDCPMLCQLQLNGLVESLRELSLTPGEDFEVISVSIDPRETPERAYLTKQRYVNAYGRVETSSGWHFLTGDQKSIERLAESVGFRYRYIPEKKEYAHAAVAMVITPDGRLSRYIYGVDYPPRTLRMALVEAGQGRIGTTLDHVLLFCFHYDAEAGRYAPTARKLMQLAGGLTLVTLLVGLIPSWRRRRRDAELTGRRDADVPSNTSQNQSSQRVSRQLAMVPLAASTGVFPDAISTTARDVDQLFWFILVVSLVFFGIIVGAMAWFLFRYRERPGHRAQPSASHNSLLEVAWSIIPGIFVGGIFLWGFVSYLDIRQPPDGSYEIQVVAKKWNWSFIYPNGHVDNNLHVPVDRPVRLVMSSDDVIHSLYVPAFRLKMDLVPGRYSTTWFEASHTGEYVLFCAEYCGTQHSQMLARVVVHASGEFDRWLENAANFLERMTPAEAGEVLYQRRGCAQCHSNDGSAKVGPSFRDVFGSQQGLADGSSIRVDENYLRESILEPQAKVRAGYKPVMPTYQGQLKDEEIAALIAYIKSLAGTGTQP